MTPDPVQVVRRQWRRARAAAEWRGAGRVALAHRGSLAARHGRRRAAGAPHWGPHDGGARGRGMGRRRRRWGGGRYSLPGCGQALRAMSKSDPSAGVRSGAALLARSGKVRRRAGTRGHWVGVVAGGRAQIHAGCCVSAGGGGAPLCAERAALMRALQEGDSQFEVSACGHVGGGGVSAGAPRGRSACSLPRTSGRSSWRRAARWARARCGRQCGVARSRARASAARCWPRTETST